MDTIKNVCGFNTHGKTEEMEERKIEEERKRDFTSIKHYITSTQNVINTDGDSLHRQLMPSNNMNRIYKRIQI